MNILTSLGILILSMLIVAFLQLPSGVFAIFSHQNLGKYSKNRAIDLASFFILGLFITNFIILNLIIFMLRTIMFSFDINIDIFFWTISGALVALSIVAIFFYFRKGKNTKLFISPKIRNAFSYRAKHTKSFSDAFVLGAISPTPELIFSFFPYLISAYEIIKINKDPFIGIATVIVFTFVTIIPVLVIHNYFINDHNLAEIQKSRVKNKGFFRFIISVLYLLLAVLIILAKVLV